MQQLFVRLFDPKPNGAERVNLLQVKISHSTLKKEIEEHLSLLSISDVLNNYGIDNVTARFNRYKFINIPTPFITQIKGDLFTVAKEVDDAPYN